LNFLLHTAKHWVRQLLVRLDIGIYRLHHAEMDANMHNAAEKMDEHYEDARVYSKEVRDERTRFQAKMLALLQNVRPSLEGLSVADVGCGTGDLLALISTLSPSARLYGYETSQGALREAALTCPQATLSTLDITAEIAGPHDVIFCLEVLEHLMDPDAALKNLLASLTPCGILVLSVPDARFDNFGGHINFWGPVSWRRFLLAHSVESLLEEGQLKDPLFRLNYALLTRRPAG